VTKPDCFFTLHVFESFTLVIYSVPTIGVASGGPGGHVPQFFRIFRYFGLLEAVFQTKYYYLPKNKHSPQKMWASYATGSSQCKTKAFLASWRYLPEWISATKLIYSGHVTYADHSKTHFCFSFGERNFSCESVELNNTMFLKHTNWPKAQYLITKVSR